MIMDPKALQEELRRYKAMQRQGASLADPTQVGPPNTLPKRDFNPISAQQADRAASNSLMQQLGNIGSAYGFQPSTNPSDYLEQAEDIMFKANKVAGKIQRRKSNPIIKQVPVSYDVPVTQYTPVQRGVPTENVTAMSSNKMPKMNPKQMSKYEAAIVAGKSHKGALKAAGVQPVNETGGPRPVARSNTAAATGGSGSFKAFVRAIAGKESGGNYSATNPSGASGKYQILRSNFEPRGRGWDMEILGRDVSYQEFMSNPKIQDAIAIGKLKQYYNKYGPRGAASAWYSGSPNNWQSTASQGAYPTVAAYVQDIIRRMGGG